MVTEIFVSTFLQGIHFRFDVFSEIDLSPTTYHVTLKDGVSLSDYFSSYLEDSRFLSVVTYDDGMDQVDSVLSSISTMTFVVQVFVILL